MEHCLLAFGAQLLLVAQFKGKRGWVNVASLYTWAPCLERLQTSGAHSFAARKTSHYKPKPASVLPPNFLEKLMLRPPLREKYLGEAFQFYEDLPHSHLNNSYRNILSNLTAFFAGKIARPWGKPTLPPSEDHRQTRICHLLRDLPLFRVFVTKEDQRNAQSK